ncbi:hypothetical protein MTO96_028811 [Rhipicephalus appendiculatus]
MEEDFGEVPRRTKTLQKTVENRVLSVNVGGSETSNMVNNPVCYVLRVRISTRLLISAMHRGVARADHFDVPGWSVSGGTGCFKIPDSSLLGGAALALTWTTSVTFFHATHQDTIKDGRKPGVVTEYGGSET